MLGGARAGSTRAAARSALTAAAAPPPWRPLPFLCPALAQRQSRRRSSDLSSSSPTSNAAIPSSSNASAPISLDSLLEQVRRRSACAPAILASLDDLNHDQPQEALEVIAGAALEAGDADLVVSLFQAAKERLDANTHTLHLHRLRAWEMQASRGERSFRDLEDYASHLEQSDGDALIPPAELYEALIDLHVRRRRLWPAQRALRAMARAGWEIEPETWLRVFDVSRRLRPYVAIAREEGIVPPRHVASVLLRKASEKDDLRACLLILRLLGLPTPSRRPSSSPTLVPPRPSFYSPLAVLLSRVPKPHHVVRTYELLTLAQGTLPEEAFERACSRQAASAVIFAHNRSSEPRRALEFAAIVHGSPYLDEAPLSSADGPRRALMQPSDFLSTSLLLRSAAMLEPSEALAVARRVLASYFAVNGGSSGAVRSSFDHLVFVVAAADPTGETQRRYEAFLRGDGDQENWRQDDVQRDRLAALRAAYEADGVAERLKVRRIKGSRPMAPGKGEKEPILAAAEVAPLTPAQRPSTTSANLSPKASPSSYAVRIRHHAVIEGDIERALAVYRDMTSEGVAPNLLHLTPLVEGLASANRIREAKRIMSGLSEHLGVEPTLKMYTAVIRSLARRRRWDDVKAELGEMRAKGIEMDDVVARIVVRGGALKEPSMRNPAEVGLKASLLLETRGEEALRLARKTPMAAIKLRFRDLTMAERHVEAHRVVEKALLAGVEPDGQLRDLVRSSGARIRSLLRRLDGEGEDDFEGVSWQTRRKREPVSKYSSRPLRTSSREYLERALSAQRQNASRLRHLSSASTGAFDQAQARGLAEELVKLARDAFVTQTMSASRRARQEGRRRRLLRE